MMTLRGLSVPDLHHKIRYAIRFGSLDDLDDAINALRIADTDTDSIIAVLVATLPVKTQLPSRSQLLRHAKTRLTSLGESAREVMAGLE